MKSFNQVYHLSARELADELPENSLHTILTSPPSWGLQTCDLPDVVFDDQDSCTRTDEDHVWGSEYCSRCGAWRGQLGCEDDVDKYVEHLVEICNAYRTALRDDGVMFLIMRDTYAGYDGGKAADSIDADEIYPQLVSGDETKYKRKNKLMVPHRVGLALQSSGWIIRNDIVWEKENPLPHWVDDRFMTTTGTIIMATQQPLYEFDLDAVREPFKSKQPTSKGLRHDEKETEQTLSVGSEPHVDGKNPGDVIECKTGNGHEFDFSVLPLKICEKPLLSGCPELACKNCGKAYVRTDVDEWEQQCECQTDATESGTVCDPFVGAGTVPTIAEIYARNWVAADISTDCVNATRKRIEDLYVAPEKEGIVHARTKRRLRQQADNPEWWG